LDMETSHPKIHVIVYKNKENYEITSLDNKDNKK